MSWVKIDDQFPDHPKVIEAGSGPGWLYVKALCWSSRNLTDGFVPSSVAVHLVSPESSDQQRDDLPWKFPEILVSVGLWEAADGGYKIHDYLKYNPSRKQVLMTRKEAKERMQTVRKKFPTRSSEVQPSPSPSPSRSPEEENITPLAPTGGNGIPEWFQGTLKASQNFSHLLEGHENFWGAMSAAYDPYEWLKWDEQVQKADAWIAANPQRRPTAKGAMRFLRNWFERAVERQRKEQRAQAPR